MDERISIVIRQGIFMTHFLNMPNLAFWQAILGLQRKRFSGFFRLNPLDSVPLLVP